MNPAAIIRPGSTPARNSAPTETPETTENRIIGMEGGIRISITAEVALFAAQSPGA